MTTINSIPNALISATDPTGVLNLQTNSTTALSIASNSQVAIANTMYVANSTTFATNVSMPNTFGFKNRVINGAQTIAQRGTSASWTAGALFSTDRFRSGSNVGWGSGVITAAQSSNAPTGFTNSLGLTVATADSLSSNYSYVLVHPIEANNMADFGMGQSWAKTITLSFWVYSSLTGTFSGALQSAGSTNRSWFYTYSIPSANTWTYITVTATGDTTTPANWLTGTSVGMYLRWHLGTSSAYTQSTTNSWINNSAGYDGVTGQTNLISTNGATFYVTGVQLEVGTQATSFDYRPYGTELALCQRYCQQRNGTQGYTVAVQLGYGNARSSTTVYWQDRLQVQMRVAPSVTFINPTGFYAYQTSSIFATAMNFDTSDVNTALGYLTSSGFTSPTFYTVGINNSSTSQVIYSAEL